MTIGDRIRQARLKAGLTQVELAALCGLRQGHITRIETGDIGEIKAETLRRIALALQVSADWLLGITDVP
jgi:transcriptional regulator with XRE-family HTH domain